MVNDNENNKDLVTLFEGKDKDKDIDLEEVGKKEEKEQDKRTRKAEKEKKSETKEDKQQQEALDRAKQAKKGQIRTEMSNASDPGKSLIIKDVPKKNVETDERSRKQDKQPQDQDQPFYKEGEINPNAPPVNPGSVKKKTESKVYAEGEINPNAPPAGRMI